MNSNTFTCRFGMTSKCPLASFYTFSIIDYLIQYSTYNAWISCIDLCKEPDQYPTSKGGIHRLVKGI